MQLETKPPPVRAAFDLEQLDIPPGNTVQLRNISWEMFENILEALGESYAVRLAYDNGILEFKMPLSGHEDDKEMIGDLVKALLEELDLEYRTLGSTTFKNKNMARGVEPDQCFYIENESAIRGKRSLDLSVDPPPDLAIEIDNTSDSRTRIDNYEALAVPELWRYDGKKLQVSRLQKGKYVESGLSTIFPNPQLIAQITQFVQESQTQGKVAAKKAFIAWVREQL
ncbi:MAG: Uma2 family endonuclease [Oscillatoria sp. SIO1A7]|nr:Uma2 family endonuclease [Oscillatoria sp. SIO1A7]